jgi:hypothetical protein
MVRDGFFQISGMWEYGVFCFERRWRILLTPMMRLAYFRSLAPVVKARGFGMTS